MSLSRNRKPREYEYASWYKSKRHVGPHVVEPHRRKTMIRMHDSAHDIHGKFRWEWRCRYCDESSVALVQFTHVPKPCNEIEWLESELESMRE